MSTKKPAQSSGAQGRQRGGKPPEGVRFQKGVSGNPGGLSRERREFLAAIRKEEEPYSKQVLAKLRGMALDGMQWAITDYLDRMGVRMPEKLELSGEDGAPLPLSANPFDPASMTSEQIRKRIEKIEAERAEILAGAKRDPGGA